jgi:ketosteroid isomerase-like protein
MIDTSTDAGRTEATLRQLMADQAAAMRSRNADYLASRYAAGAVTFDLAPPLQSGGSGVHEHNSTPFYMDGSLRAAVDLTP